MATDRPDTRPGDKFLGYVYVAERSDGLVKIGRSKNPVKRLADLDTQFRNYGNLSLTRTAVSRPCTNSSKVERSLHALFAKHRRGGEMFFLPYDLAVRAMGESSYRDDSAALAERDRCSGEKLLDVFRGSLEQPEAEPLAPSDHWSPLYESVIHAAVCITTEKAARNNWGLERKVSFYSECLQDLAITTLQMFGEDYRFDVVADPDLGWMIDLVCDNDPRLADPARAQAVSAALASLSPTG